MIAITQLIRYKWWDGPAITIVHSLTCLLWWKIVSVWNIQLDKELYQNKWLLGLHHGKLTRMLIFFFFWYCWICWLFWYNVNKLLLKFQLFPSAQQFPEPPINMCITWASHIPFWTHSLLFKLWGLKYWLSNVSTNSTITWLWIYSCYLPSS